MKTNCVGAEIVTWWSSSPGTIRVEEWPTYIPQTLWLTSKPKGIGDLLSTLGAFGFRIKAIIPFRYGFLWLKKGERVVLEREFVWLRDGDQFSYVGSRITPPVEEQLVRSNKVYPQDNEWI
jgi:hypothetical protein